MTNPNLTCGCRLCGCVCAEHSTTRRADPCAHHGGSIVRWLLEDAAALVSIALFCGTIAVWAMILTGPKTPVSKNGSAHFSRVFTP